MSKCLRSLIVLFFIGDFTNASVICMSSPQPRSTVYQSETLKFIVLAPNGVALLTTLAKVSATDSAPFGHVAKTYSQADGTIVTSIHYLYGRPYEIADPVSGKELKLSHDSETSAQQSSDCYKIGP